ncbi:unnamed protein product [Amoebophrya sp. A120]|nr:unnamed protein product [Amoebophrya sp. A120]|eukprot:GSA120T00013167001.1
MRNWKTPIVRHGFFGRKNYLYNLKSVQLVSGSLDNELVISIRVHNSHCVPPGAYPRARPKKIQTQRRFVGGAFEGAEDLKINLRTLISIFYNCQATLFRYSSAFLVIVLIFFPGLLQLLWLISRIVIVMSALQSSSIR